MGSNDVSNEVADLGSYLAAWKEVGFDVSLPGGEATSIKPSEFTELQSMVESAIELKVRMEPFQDSEKIERLISTFRDPNNLAEIQSQFLDWIADNAPWEPGYFRWYPNWWMSEETRSQFWDLVNISSSLDESSWTSLDLLLPLLSDPKNYPNIIKELEQLVHDEKRQRDLLEKAVFQLKEKGYTIAFESMKIIDQFDEIERLQTYSNQVDLLELQIQSNILPFDPVLADTFTGRLKELMTTPSEELNTLQKNVATISEHLQVRLNEMNALLRQWHSEGYSYEDRSMIQPEELLEWEHLLPEIEQQYHRHAGASERWKEIQKLWGIEDPSIEQIVGKLQHTDAFLDKIDALEQQWTEKELQGASLIERWEQLGFEMDVWRYKITQDPRQGLFELNQQLPFYERANELLERMLQLDTSLGGEEEVEGRTTILRTMDLENDLLDEMQHWIDKKTLRNTRHRRMLQSEWERAVREGKADPTITFSDLHSFESAIASLEHQTQHIMSSGATSHAIGRTKAELLRLETRGWNISELLQLQEEQPDSFFQQFSNTIEAMSRIQSTQRRLANLDWRRDVQRATEVSIKVRNPLQLMKLERQIPALIRHLAEREIEDEDYTYVAWLPEQRPVLLPREQSLVRKVPAKVQPRSTLEEAHEAMLEAMDHNPATDVVEAETIPNNEGDSNEVTPEEWRHPETKHPHDDGVSDEEFFADDKWSVERWSGWRERQQELELARQEQSDNDNSNQPTSQPAAEEAKTLPERRENSVEEKPKTAIVPASSSVVEGDLTSYEGLLRLIGLTEEADILAGSNDISIVRRALASYVGDEPRDIRVDRLLRLVLRLLPLGDHDDSKRSKMIDVLGKAIPKYNQWVRMRLEARHMGASGDFFEDATRLGIALHRVPGPGVRVPLKADVLPLPETSNLNELQHQTERLVQSMNLPAAGGIN
ncbi:MAG: hypothetical protein ACPG64_04320 [Candidatus Poseidoniaceae archaeon]